MSTRLLSHTLTLWTRRKLTGYKPIQPVPLNIYCTYQSVFKKPTISVQSLVLLLPVIVARILNVPFSLSIDRDISIYDSI